MNFHDRHFTINHQTLADQKLDNVLLWGITGLAAIFLCSLIWFVWSLPEWSWLPVKAMATSAVLCVVAGVLYRAGK